MQWKRRHCCTHTAKFLSLLSLLGLLVFLVQQMWLPNLTHIPQCRGNPVVYGGDEHNTTKAKHSAPHSGRFVTVPQLTIKADANISSPKKVGASSPQGHLSFESALAAKSSQSVEGDLRENITHGPFTYIINEPGKCADSRPFLVLLIATEARQVEARNAIRQTWGNESVAQTLGFTRLFLLGKKEGRLGNSYQRTLEEESRRHHDIIQQDFLDSYKNLTLKTLMGMNWVAIHCPQANYVMKTDSDMFVNTEYLIYKLLRPELKPKQNYFTGYCMSGAAPIRDKKSKWYMPPELYPGDKYPDFCSGTGYVFSGDLAGKIYRASLKIPYLYLEDVYVGICLAELQIKPTPPPNEFLFNNGRVPYSSCKYSHLITSHYFKPNEILKYWHRLQKNKNNTCINKYKAGRKRSNRKYRERPAPQLKSYH